MLEGRTTLSLSLTAGGLYGLDGEVQETTRPIEVIGGPTSGAPPENYSWDELGFDDRTAALGLRVEKMWRFVTLQFHGYMARPTVKGVADRDFYIGVEEVVHNGRVYEYMQIPEGRAYDGEIDVFSLDTRLLITPITIGMPDTAQFTPWIHLGLFTFYGDYEIRAGASEGVIQYENPPRDYVVGGTGKGTAAIVVPEIGLGGELRIPMSDSVYLNLQGHVGLLRYSGSTGDFGISSRNEKSMDVDYTTYAARATLEIELNDRVDLLIGGELVHRRGTAEVRATDKPEEDVLALREKFDKDVRFEMTLVSLFVGVQF